MHLEKKRYRPRIEANVVCTNGRIPFILNPGAPISLIKKHVIKDFSVVKTHNLINISGITRKSFMTLGSITTKIQGFWVKLHVVSDDFPIREKGILGRNFFKTNNVKFNREKSCITFHNGVSIPYINYPRKSKYFYKGKMSKDKKLVRSPEFKRDETDTAREFKSAYDNKVDQRSPSEKSIVKLNCYNRENLSMNKVNQSENTRKLKSSVNKRVNEKLESVNLLKEDQTSSNRVSSKKKKKYWEDKKIISNTEKNLNRVEEIIKVGEINVVVNNVFNSKSHEPKFASLARGEKYSSGEIRCLPDEGVIKHYLLDEEVCDYVTLTNKIVKNVNNPNAEVSETIPNEKGGLKIFESEANRDEDNKYTTGESKNNLKIEIDLTTFEMKAKIEKERVGKNEEIKLINWEPEFVVGDLILFETKSLPNQNKNENLISFEEINMLGKIIDTEASSILTPEIIEMKSNSLSTLSTSTNVESRNEQLILKSADIRVCNDCISTIEIDKSNEDKRKILPRKNESQQSKSFVSPMYDKNISREQIHTFNIENGVKRNTGKYVLEKLRKLIMQFIHLIIIIFIQLMLFNN